VIWRSRPFGSSQAFSSSATGPRSSWVWFAEPGAQKMALAFPQLPWFAGVIELVGGALIVLGLFTRIVAFLASGEMAFAYFMVHAPNGPLPIMNHGELAALYSFLFLFLAAHGGGPFSLDATTRKRRRA